MKHVFLVAGVLVAAAVATPASAQRLGQYPWCSQYGNASAAQSCSFASYGQCMETVSGIGGYCFRNPAYGHVRRHY